VSSNFQASGFYATSDPSTAAYLANILMVSWDTQREEMILKIDYTNLPDYIDKRAYTFGWDLLSGEVFYGNARKTIAFPNYNIVVS
jgi:hypothetical protein